MAVSKTQPFEVVAAAIQAGLRNLGENRVQEAVEKKEAISLEASWELIGHLQTNKARLAVTHFDRIQSVDRLKLIQALDRHCHELGRERLPVLLQVNAGDDPAKFGTTVDDAEGLAEAIVGTPHLQLDGLMTVPPLDQDRMVARKCFARLCKLRDKLRVNLGQSLDVLSMGMSGDFEEAIAEGSTLIRVGTALFGSRD